MFMKSVGKKAAGSDEAWIRQMIHQYKGLVFSTARDYIKDVQLVEDVVNDVFYKISIHRTKLSELNDSECAAFISVMAKNTAIDYLRKTKKQENILYIEELNDEAALEWIDLLESIGEIKIGSYIDPFLEQLGEPEQCILWLRYREGLTYQEIGEVLNIKTETVKKRIYRAIGRLREIIKNSGGQER